MAEEFRDGIMDWDQRLPSAVPSFDFSLDGQAFLPSGPALPDRSVGVDVQLDPSISMFQLGGISDQNLFGPVIAQDASLMGPSPILHPVVETPAIPVNMPTEDQQPVKARSRLTQQDWEARKAEIKNYYIDRRLSLADTMRMMEKSGFHASARKYKDKLKSWGFEKNLNPIISKFIRKKALGRKKNSLRTQFHINGRPLTPEKLERHCCNHTYSQLSTTGKTPSVVQYQTPVTDGPVISPIAQAQHAISPEVLTASSVLRLEWNGVTLDSLHNLFQRSLQQAHTGGFVEALPGFQEAIDGVEAVMGSTHSSTLRLIHNFSDTAVRHGHIDEAEARLRKSMDDHEREFGHSHEKTLRSFARLGLFYRDCSRLSEAEILLRASITGTFDMAHLTDEEKFQNTLQLVLALVKILETRSDFDEAEKALLDQIEHAHKLGPAYQSDHQFLKHTLAHVYCLWNKTPIDDLATARPSGRLFRILSELLVGCETHQGVLSEHDFCCLNMFLEVHLETHDMTRLEASCTQVEELLQSARHIRRPNCSKEIKLKSTLARCYGVMTKPDRAEWWLVHLQEQIDADEHLGPDSRQSLENTMQHALIFVDTKQWEQAEPLLLEAQKKAKKILTPMDSFHERISECLRTRRYRQGCGHCCIN